MIPRSSFYAELYRQRRPIVIRHPWMRGSRQDIIDILRYLKGSLGGVFTWLEDVGASFLQMASSTAKKVVNYLGLTPDEKRQVIVSTASTMKKYTEDLLERIDKLARIYMQPGTYMKPGERGEHVKLLQSVLNELGIVYPPLEVDGIYGSKTMDAVRKLQQILGVKVDGYFGFYTAQALRNKANELVQKSSWWRKLLNIVMPIVGVAIKKPEIQDKLDDIVRRSVAYGKPVISVGVELPKEEVPEKKGPFGLSWPVLIGLGLLAVVAITTLRKK